MRIDRMYRLTKTFYAMVDVEIDVMSDKGKNDEANELRYDRNFLIDVGEKQYSDLSHKQKKHLNSLILKMKTKELLK